jgi:5-methylcytosine-specific restriction endonuclease McrA
MLPLSIWSWQDTVKAVLSGKAVVVEIYPDIYVRAVNLDVPVPSVIALREYAPTGKARPAFTRRNVFLRDGYRCQYCSGLFRTSDLSLDHVEPRCLGGRLVWENTVTCCKRCNGRKGSLRPTELHRVGMELRSRPRCPTLFELAAEATKFVPRKVHATWAPYLGISPMSSAAVAVASSSLAGVHDDGRSAPDGDGGRERRKRMKKFRPYE